VAPLAVSVVLVPLQMAVGVAAIATVGVVPADETVYWAETLQEEAGLIVTV